MLACADSKAFWTKTCARQCGTSLFSHFSIFFSCISECLEFQNIKGLAGSRGNENICVSSWSTPLGSSSSCRWSWVCVRAPRRGKTCPSSRLKGVEWNRETISKKNGFLSQCATSHQQTPITVWSRYDLLIVQSCFLLEALHGCLQPCARKQDPTFLDLFAAAVPSFTLCGPRDYSTQHGAQMRLSSLQNTWGFASWKPIACKEKSS